MVIVGGGFGSVVIAVCIEFVSMENVLNEGNSTEKGMLFFL